MMEAKVVSVLVNGAQLALQTYFSYMSAAGKTPEEARALFELEKAKFEDNKPEDLPEV